MERKGICKNIGVCSKANKVQIITDEEAEFVCPECGEKLEEVKELPAEEPKSNKKPLLILIALVVIAAIVTCILLFSKSTPEQEESSVVADTTQVVVKADSVETQPMDVDTTSPAEELAPQEEPEEVKEPAQASKQELDHTDLGYAKYYGKVNAKGLPHDKGARMVYSQVRRISQYDSQNRKSAVGDYIIGEWLNGELVQGRWYDKNNNLKGSIIIGVR